MKILTVIPARGGSKGIPRKNLRSLAGRPLIYYSIATAMNSRFQQEIYVSTDDSEIASIARRLGANVVMRENSLSEDHVTLDPVIHDCFLKAQKDTGIDFDLVVSLQPTSPLLSSESLDSALEKIMDNTETDTIISAKNETHLYWRLENERYIPDYSERLNRQYLKPFFKETGGFLISRIRCISPTNRVGKNIDLHILDESEAIDIDDYADWSLCHYYLLRKKILFVVTGSEIKGLGHVYNSMSVANEILNHHIEFLVDTESQLAFEKIATKNYLVHMQTEDNILNDISRLSPDVVINDCLDTTAEYINGLIKLGCTVINFEDVGPGAEYADLVINALYPEKRLQPKHYFGHNYFIFRDEFYLSHPRPVAERVSRVLLTFGGVDPNNFTRKVVSAIYHYCEQHNITIDVVTGFGYKFFDSLNEFDCINLVKNTSSISELMVRSDIIFTSAGRTTYEVASLEVPTIVIAQNERELTHFFSSAEQGFLNLGLGENVSEAEVLDAFTELVEDMEAREHMKNLMSRFHLLEGRQNVMSLIRKLLDQV